MDWSGVVDHLYENQAVNFGSFELKSGIVSPFYIDLRPLLCTPSFVKACASQIESRLRSENLLVESICGVPYAAVSVAICLSLNMDLPMIIRRKEVKLYGMKRILEGNIVAGQNCLIIEDVVTTGSSVKETAEILRDNGLVVTDAVVIFDREQGAFELLQKNGIRLHSLLKISSVLDELLSKGKISNDMIVAVRQFLSSSSGQSDAAHHSRPVVKRRCWEDRLKLMTNPISKRLVNIMIAKQSNLCVAVDLTTTAEVLRVVSSIGDKICCLKLHADIISDWSDAFVSALAKLAADMNFMVMEDRKFADIGSTVEWQLTGGVHKIVNWADLITAHSAPGAGLLKGLAKGCGDKHLGCLLIAEMSSEGNLLQSDYKEKTVAMASENRQFVVGFVCQKRVVVDETFLFFSPGVNLSSETCALGQQFRHPRDAILYDGVDLIIVGRGVYKKEHQVAEEAEKYRRAAWEAYQESLQQH